MESLGPSRGAASCDLPRSGDRDRARGVGGLKLACKKASCSAVKGGGVGWSAGLSPMDERTENQETETGAKSSSGKHR